MSTGKTTTNPQKKMRPSTGESVPKGQEAQPQSGILDLGGGSLFSTAVAGHRRKRPPPEEKATRAGSTTGDDVYTRTSGLKTALKLLSQYQNGALQIPTLHKLYNIPTRGFAGTEVNSKKNRSTNMVQYLKKAKTQHPSLCKRECPKL